MEHFRAFPKHLSSIVWSSNLLALQPVDGKSLTPGKWKFFESSRVGELLLVRFQCKLPNV